MFDKLDDVEKKYEDISSEIQTLEMKSQKQKYADLMKEFVRLGPIVETYREYKKTKENLKGSKDILSENSDSEMKSMARDEVEILTKKLHELESQLQVLLTPEDPHDGKNVIIEIRAGAGGNEASLFAHELFRAYTHFADHKGWKVETLSLSEGNVGGVKEIIGMISGKKVFSQLKFESGVHRVQRVPETETQGRVHTSTVTVAVLPEAEAVDVEINPSEIKIDVFRASGAGGQHVNTTDSAVRITHLSSGIVVSCQDEKSQIKNKSKAMKILYARLLDKQKRELEQEASSERLSQIGTGDRSERIRTYNFPQSRLTDHRIGLTTYNLSQIMQGHLSEVIKPLQAHFQAQALKEEL